ncbi:predicted protein [Postia placenta Mad-698-R]|nr:predicted protein [Postia placenta Mad-698-R]
MCTVTRAETNGYERRRAMLIEGTHGHVSTRWMYERRKSTGAAAVVLLKHPVLQPGHLCFASRIPHARRLFPPPVPSFDARASGQPVHPPCMPSPRQSARIWICPRHFLGVVALALYSACSAALGTRSGRRERRLGRETGRISSTRRLWPRRLAREGMRAGDGAWELEAGRVIAVDRGKGGSLRLSREGPWCDGSTKHRAEEERANEPALGYEARHGVGSFACARVYPFAGLSLRVACVMQRAPVWRSGHSWERAASADGMQGTRVAQCPAAVPASMSCRRRCQEPEATRADAVPEGVQPVIRVWGNDQRPCWGDGRGCWGAVRGTLQAWERQARAGDEGREIHLVNRRPCAAGVQTAGQELQMAGNTLSSLTSSSRRSLAPMVEDAVATHEKPRRYRKLASVTLHPAPRGRAWTFGHAEPGPVDIARAGNAPLRCPAARRAGTEHARETVRVARAKHTRVAVGALSALEYASDVPSLAQDMAVCGCSDVRLPRQEAGLFADTYDDDRPLTTRGHDVPFGHTSLGLHSCRADNACVTHAKHRTGRGRMHVWFGGGQRRGDTREAKAGAPANHARSSGVAGGYASGCVVYAAGPGAVMPTLEPWRVTELAVGRCGCGCGREYGGQGAAEKTSDTAACVV